MSFNSFEIKQKKNKTTSNTLTCFKRFIWDEKSKTAKNSNLGKKPEHVFLIKPKPQTNKTTILLLKK